ncbi:MAG: hypothetical protein FWG08_01830 [Propionibacteriaceae bacterium]|nr:hypothetical protein [Propionibacteriaceae bacterium]
MAVATASVCQTIWVDHSWFGKANIFISNVAIEDIGRISVGEKVWVYGDSIAPYLCKVTEVFNGGQTYRFERIEL